MATVAYEPTRGIGHAMGQHYGITPSPAVSVTEAEADDVILVASDGLWSKNPLKLSIRGGGGGEGWQGGEA